MKEPAREGLAIPVGEVEYNVFLTRQMNFEIVPDKAYFDGPPAPPGSAYYGIFLQACNTSDEPQQTARHLVVKDNQDREFEPVEVPEDNQFAYRPARLAPGKCVPQTGSVAELGPTEAVLLLYLLPLSATENRPLELEIQAPSEAPTGKREHKEIELDV